MNCVKPVKVWTAQEDIPLHVVLEAVLEARGKGFLKPDAGLDLNEEEAKLLTFCKFADEHFLSEETVAQLSSAQTMEA